MRVCVTVCVRGSSARQIDRQGYTQQGNQQGSTGNSKQYCLGGDKACLQQRQLAGVQSFFPRRQSTPEMHVCLVLMCVLLVGSTHMHTGRTVSDKCQEDVAQYRIARSQHINRDVALGESISQ